MSAGSSLSRSNVGGHNTLSLAWVYESEKKHGNNTILKEPNIPVKKRDRELCPYCGALKIQKDPIADFIPDAADAVHDLFLRALAGAGVLKALV